MRMAAVTAEVYRADLTRPVIHPTLPPALANELSTRGRGSRSTRAREASAPPKGPGRPAADATLEAVPVFA